jgi:hypothetical protein
MRKSYVYDPETKKMVPLGTTKKDRRAPYIQPDLPDYRPVGGPEAQAFIDNPSKAKMISGRKQHREYLRRNGFIEVGNEKKEFMRYGGMTKENYQRWQPSPEVRKYLEASKRDR